MTLPSFVILGAQKAGTTWLAHHLRKNDQVFMPPKEVHFFDVPENYKKGINWYLQHFEDAGPDKITGEKTPDYLWTYRGTDFHAGLVERISHDLPETKLIVTLRDPVSRAISAINHQINKGRLSVRNDLERTLLDASMKGVTRWGLIERGYYAREVSRFFDRIPKERFLFLFYEDDIKNMPLETLNRVESFIGLQQKTIEIIDNRPINASRRTLSFGPIERALPFVKPLTTRLSKAISNTSTYWRSEDLEQQLTKYYAPKNEELFELLGHRTYRWR